MKRVLFTANTDRHIILCHLPYLRWFQKRKYIVDVATNTDKKVLYCDNKYKLQMKRSPFAFSNIKAVFQLINILRKNKYDLIHTHTPVGSVVTRIACIFSKTNAKVFYTCHGFHFYRGAPFYYWLLFYPVEKILMHFVDVLILMNQEDYLFAKKHFKKTDVRYILGVGFNQERLDKKVNKFEIDKVYKELAIPKNAFVVSYVAEYSHRKRQVDFIKVLSKTNIRDTNIKILFIGDDTLNGKLNKLVKKYNLTSIIRLVPFTTDILLYYHLSDLILSCSRQEGLPLNVMEAIYMKKILLVTSCRGNNDLVVEGVNGFIVNQIKEIYPKILDIQKNYKKYKKNYREGIDIQNYTSSSVLKKVVEIYEEYL